MKKLLLFSFVMMSSNLMAQFNFDASYFPQAGDAYSIYTVDTVAQQGSAGNNQTWNFSGLKTAHYADQTYVNAASTKYANIFPTANLSILTDKDTYVYYKVSATEFSVLGTESKTASGGDSIEVRQTNKPKQQYWAAPLVYNTKQSYDFTGETVQNYQGSTISTIYRKGNTSSILDANGTIILPDGESLTDIVRLKTTQTVQDSMGTVIPGYYSITTTVIDTYNYYQKGNRTSLFGISVTNIASTSFAFGTPTTNTSKGRAAFLYKSGGTVGIDDNLLVLSKSIYPNPVNQGSILTLPAEIVKISVSDIAGNEKFTAEVSGSATIDLPAGIYLLRSYNSKGSSVTTKLTVL